ncbi:putative disease resistance protein At1g59780 isoform X2 [Ipomoea triloba]|uniref:putative disease resistance protein At1g59780 isoform X2 n=1 Tax=Ipomoea triloba TaxID=35885 RepID=UPI00125E3FE7|nr:putative disease resistance protein At1g59780 isoform X2 [Ipomoea triloba]
MAYAAVTSLMETLSLHFLQSQPRFPLEDLEAQIRLGNENVGLLQQILEAQITEKEESSKRLRIKACFPRDYGKQQLAWDTTLLNSQLKEVGEVKQKIVSLHQNLGLLQQSLDKSEIPYDARVMKDLEAKIRDASFKLEERIEMELSAIYLAKDSLRITACLLRLHQIFNEAQKQIGYQIRDGNENLGLLQQLVNAQIFEMGLDEETSSLKKAYQQQQHRLKEKMVSFSQNLGLLQHILEIGNDDAARVAMKSLWGEMRDYERYFSIKAQEWIEMELTTFYLAKDSLLHITACLLRLHQIFIEAQKQTDYHKNELIRIQTHKKYLHDLVHFSKNASKFDGGMVGCDKLFKNILDQLLTQQTTKGRQVVSIVGMGGIGKTTLAHKLYQHPSITSYFDKRAWVTVSQEYNLEQMLRCLLSCVTATASRDGQDQLAKRLRKHLKDQRYLIVMDDIWSTTAWDNVQRCLPDDNNGSRILLTSRLKEVAEYASSET